ncbi:MAG: cell envelope protein SmpA, partial [Pseudomonadota bacterium]|nr:cell envelope protein SmpA [Pseudomonadota bacterium]
REPTVVGRSEDKCGNLINASQRREAIINKRIVAGMSLQDVESALGKPDKVSIRNSATSYRYDNKRGRSAHIEFDERGCMREKAKSRTAKSPR